MTMPSYSVDPLNPIIDDLSHVSDFSNIYQSSGTSQNSSIVLPKLQHVLFRSPDRMLDAILRNFLPSKIDAEDLIKTDIRWCDDILINLKNYVVESIFFFPNSMSTTCLATFDFRMYRSHLSLS
jgi:hypothetical protein